MFENAPPSAGEVRALANQLLSWADLLSARAAAETALSEEQEHEVALIMAEAARNTALLRSRFFPEVPFANLNWDVMLELFIRTSRGFRVPPETFELERDVPPDAIRRSLEELRAQGLVERIADRFDPRVVWLSLSHDGSRRMTAMLIEAARYIQGKAGELGGLAAELSGISRSA